MELDKQVRAILKRIPQQSIFAFLGALTVGFADYLYTMTNHFLTDVCFGTLFTYLIYAVISTSFEKAC